MSIFLACNPISSDTLFESASLVTPRRKHVTFTPLDEDELPRENDIVGLDAEFVTLNQEEAELRSDGTRSTIKPSQMSVARVTCTRGYVTRVRAGLGWNKVTPGLLIVTQTLPSM